jgi:FlaA1/EpsC-like NDP-sugar epimerase
MTMNLTSLLLFVLFALVLFGMYVAIRRHWGPPLVVAALGVISSVVVMTLSGLARRSTLYQSVVAGLLVGGLFSIGVLAMAYYFSTNEQRKKPTTEPEL